VQALKARAAIIVPILAQRDDFLAVCLDSAVNQTVSCEILVVTSDQTPRSNLDVIYRFQDEFPNLLVLRRQRPSFAAAINTGIEAAQAPRVSLLFSDDWLDVRAVELCLAHDADIVSGDVAIYDETGMLELALKKPRTWAAYNQIPSLKDRADYLGHFLLFRRDLLLSIGGVDETIGNVGPDDFDMIWSLLEADASVMIVEEKLYCCRDHSGTRLTLRPKEEQVRDLEKILDKHGVFGAERERCIALHGRWFGRTLQEVVASNMISSSSA
jgi:glycosyltransferase involved in cell wall biosynthesis